jgi:hypothetical protein
MDEGELGVFTVRFLSKKNNQTEFFFLKKPKPVQTDRFRFGFLEKKTGSNRFGSVFSVLARFGWVFFWFFFRFGSVRFFRFQA